VKGVLTLCLVQEQMVLRHHNEAESLNAVQKMDWEWKLAEINAGAKVKVRSSDMQTTDRNLVIVKIRCLVSRTLFRAGKNDFFYIIVKIWGSVRGSGPFWTDPDSTF
jgi:hypothetical protein